MFGRRCGKMTARAWLSRETDQTSVVTTVAVGVLATLCYLTMRILCGNPYRIMLELGISDLVPPVWLFTVLWALAFFTAGCAAGFVLGYRPLGCAAEKYKGCMIYVLAAAVELCWYPTMFAGGLVFFALLESFLAMFLAVLTTVSFFRVSRFAGILFVLHDVWVFSILVLSFRIFLRN
ncbi:MAG: tryptophan-rich sensory protein [Clostridia bacterium]|nr:tryptophan-rich sensory protein [Clostridia bacterium]